ncbi:MAG: CBS domain-containing protein [Gemmatimonadota bacterium]
MRTVSDLMTPEVLSLEPDMSLRDAMEILSTEGVTGAPVVAGSRLVGVLSTTDLIDFQGSVTAAQGPSDTRPTLREELGGGGLPDDDMAENPGSFFADYWSDSGADVYQRLAQSEGPEWDLLERHTVEEAMTRKVVSVEPDEGIAEVAKLMIDRGIHRVLVTQNDSLVGILTSTDLVRAIAEGKLSPAGDR